MHEKPQGQLIEDNESFLARARTSSGVSQDSRTAKRTWCNKHDSCPPPDRAVSYETCSLLTSCLARLGIYVLMVLGYLNQLLLQSKLAAEADREGYPSLYDKFDQFYFRYLIWRGRDCLGRPVSSAPGAELTIRERARGASRWSLSFTGALQRCINLGSYNYLGFSEREGECVRAAIVAAGEGGLTLASPREELGSCALHRQLEALTALFVGAEAALVVGMGFATNAMTLPALLDSGCLAVSDEYNHASLILGLRLSGARVAIFRHNDMRHLEEVVREGIMAGRGGAGEPWQPWRKVLVLVEGVYSMEGSVVPLPQVLAIKEKYGCYVYLDEAHSVGAMGPQGRGVTDYFGVDPARVDILMGTFTKSFGSAGGYIAGSKKLINYIRRHGQAGVYACSMSPPVAQQVITSMSIIMGLQGGPQGSQRISALARNTRYFRRRLHQMGVIIHGHEDSPVVPLLVFSYSKLILMIRELTELGVAAVAVGFPATPLLESRIRFCVSAVHTRRQLDTCLQAIEHVARRLGLLHSRRPREPHPILY